MKATNMLRMLGAALIPWVVSAQTAPKPDCWPKFWYKGVVTNKDTMKYNPTNEFIFPSVFHAGAHLDNPLGEWYLYYAPHDNPGGVSLMYADNVEGPWTEYQSNPVIANKWSPHYDVPHTSSAHAIWNDEAGKVFVYFHGPNSATRWAETSDGINFTYGGVAVSTSMVGGNEKEASYARVFKHPNPSSGYKYAMFYMSNWTQPPRRIRLAESRDGRTWTVEPNYILSPGPEEEGNVSSADLWEWNGQKYIIYHASSGNSYARTIDDTLRNVGSMPILLHESSGKGDDVGRIAAPNLFVTDGWLYIFYESGDRLGATIAWGKASKETSNCGLQ